MIQQKNTGIVSLVAYCSACKQFAVLYLATSSFKTHTLSGLKVVGEVKKVGKSRNFEPKVGKSRNFSVFKVEKSRNFISVFITFLYTGMSNMRVSFADFKANHIFF